jgi:hypothetical protein
VYDSIALYWWEQENPTVVRLIERYDMQSITLQVNEEAAKVFLAAPERKRKTLEFLISDWLTHDSETPPMLEMMDRLARSARENGLTEEKLNEILADG